jgi:DNA-binding NarL/FixJ family response regulator
MTLRPDVLLHVLLVGFRPNVSWALRDGLPGDGDIDVAVAVDADDALVVAGAGPLDIALVDADATNVDPVAATRALAGTMRVVLLAERDDEDLAFACLDAGAVGYLRKDAALSHLREALRGVARGEAAVTRVLTTALVDRFRAADRASSSVSNR